MTGRLYTLGYAAPDSEQHLKAIMDECGDMATIVDIRRAPHSRWHPAWRRNALLAYWGFKYVWKGSSLGNRNYRQPGGPIALPDDVETCGPAEGIPYLVGQLRMGRNLILLCACASYEQCHRKTIAELVKKHLPDVEVRS